MLLTVLFCVFCAIDPKSGPLLDSGSAGLPGAEGEEEEAEGEKAGAGVGEG